MKNMTIEAIAEACESQYSGPEQLLSKEVAGITLDSRKIEHDWLFVATRGERVDGHTFLPQAVEKGAVCVICEKPPKDSNIPFIQVTDSFEALKKIAACYRRSLDLKVVGITGSVGKTSTKEMIATVLSEKFNVLKTAGNFNNEIGLPLTIFNLKEEHEVAVLEMGISDFGEMHRLGEIANPDICVITNIGQCHLENLGSRDGIFRAKTEIFEHMREGGTAVLNGNDDKLAAVLEVNGREPRFFYDNIDNLLKKGEEPDSHAVYATDIVSRGLFGTDCMIHTQYGEFKAEIPVPGRHQVANALAAAQVGLLMGMNEEEIIAGIKKAQTIGGRTHIRKGTTYTIIDDCYNANPVSMKAALDLLEEADGRKVAILGDMFELGKDSDALHYEVGKYGREHKIDQIICIGENARHIYEGAQGGKAFAFHFASKEEFLDRKDEVLQKDDTILLKASHGMAFETLKEALED